MALFETQCILEALCSDVNDNRLLYTVFTPRVLRRITPDDALDSKA